MQINPSATRKYQVEILNSAYNTYSYSSIIFVVLLLIMGDPEITDNVPWGIILLSTEAFKSNSKFM